MNVNLSSASTAVSAAAASIAVPAEKSAGRSSKTHTTTTVYVDKENQAPTAAAAIKGATVSDMVGRKAARTILGELPTLKIPLASAGAAGPTTPTTMISRNVEKKKLPLAAVDPNAVYSSKMSALQRMR